MGYWLMPKKHNNLQLNLPDIEQMALFEASLPEITNKRGLEDILRDGDATEMGLFVQSAPYKTLRIEMTHCGYDLSQIKDKKELYETFWPELMRKLKERA